MILPNYDDNYIKYEGDILDNMKHGYDIYNVKYEGEWRKDKFHGSGKLYFSIDNIMIHYNGVFINNHYHGEGILYVNNIVKYSCNWFLSKKMA